jgi:hypothetical protein
VNQPGPGAGLALVKEHLALTFPTIHMNGTSPKDLLEDQMRAMASIATAIEDIQRAGPNGRDYYTQGPDAFAQARMEHEQRLVRLIGVRKELEQIAEHVAQFT